MPPSPCRLHLSLAPILRRSARPSHAITRRIGDAFRRGARLPRGLAEGRRARPRKAPCTVPKEHKLQTEVADVLRSHARPEWQWSHFPAGERRDVRTGARLKRMGLQRGWADFQLVSPSDSLPLSSRGTERS